MNVTLNTNKFQTYNNQNNQYNQYRLKSGISFTSAPGAAAEIGQEVTRAAKGSDLFKSV